MTAELCLRCSLPATVDPALGIHVCPPPRQRKPRSQRQRNLVHVLLTDGTYIELLEKSEGRPLSEWVREAIEEKLRRGAPSET